MSNLPEEPAKAQIAQVVRLDPQHLGAPRGDLNAIRRTLDETREQQAHLGETPGAIERDLRDPPRRNAQWLNSVRADALQLGRYRAVNWNRFEPPTRTRHTGREPAERARP